MKQSIIASVVALIKIPLFLITRAALGTCGRAGSRAVFLSNKSYDVSAFRVNVCLTHLSGNNIGSSFLFAHQLNNCPQLIFSIGLGHFNFESASLQWPTSGGEDGGEGLSELHEVWCSVSLVLNKGWMMLVAVAYCVKIPSWVFTDYWAAWDKQKRWPPVPLVKQLSISSPVCTLETELIAQYKEWVSSSFSDAKSKGVYDP